MFLLYGGLFFLLLSRFVFIQYTGTAEGQVLSTKAEHKYSREQVLQASRGKIVDRNGEIIAQDTLSYKMIAVISPNASNNSGIQRHVSDPANTAKVLAKYIDMTEQEITSL
ncbi:MAG: penicillin-binding protein, partial [Psychrobacillus psychrotolerans]